LPPSASAVLVTPGRRGGIFGITGMSGVVVASVGFMRRVAAA
jgi:hypothetical protein